MTPEEEHNQDVARVVSACALLGEHFDAVQIFVSKHEKERTFTAHRGTGNWLLRFGQVQEWTIYEEERIRMCARKNEPNDEAPPWNTT